MSLKSSRLKVSIIRIIDNNRIKYFHFLYRHLFRAHSIEYRSLQHIHIHNLYSRNHIRPTLVFPTKNRRFHLVRCTTIFAPGSCMLKDDAIAMYIRPILIRDTREIRVYTIATRRLAGAQTCEDFYDAITFIEGYTWRFINRDSPIKYRSSRNTVNIMRTSRNSLSRNGGQRLAKKKRTHHRDVRRERKRRSVHQSRFTHRLNVRSRGITIVIYYRYIFIHITIAPDIFCVPSTFEILSTTAPPSPPQTSWNTTH